MTLGPDDMILPEMAMVTVHPQMRFEGRPFEERCEAAMAGGFAGLGLSLASYRAEREGGRSDADLTAILRNCGLVISEIESISMPGPDMRDDFRQSVEAILEMADLFGADHFFVVAADLVPLESHIETFAWLCDQCAAHNLQVGIEFMDIPYVSGARDLQSGLRIALGAGRPNGGLMVDTYHFFNGPSDWRDLETLDGARVKGIQMSDGTVPRTAPDYIEDTLHFRAPPGEGQFDLVRFVRTMDTIGSPMPYSVEVIDDDLQGLPAVDAGRRLGAATRGILQAARA
jgi:sugar phosphate isomerase/epimerase